MRNIPWNMARLWSVIFKKITLINMPINQGHVEIFKFFKKCIT